MAKKKRPPAPPAMSPEEVTRRTEAVLELMSVAHKERSSITISSEDCGAVFESFLAQKAAADSAECVVRQVARDTFGEELTVEEYADRAGYDS